LNKRTEQGKKFSYCKHLRDITTCSAQENYQARIFYQTALFSMTLSDFKAQI